MAERKNNKNNRYDNEKNKKSTFFSRLAGYDKDGKGVKKKKITDKERFGLKGFFIVYKNQFWNLIFLNLMFMLLLLPAICALLVYTGVFDTRVTTPSNILYAPVYGMHLASPTPATSALTGIYGADGAVLMGNSITGVLTFISFLTFLTFGFANAGMTYILRAYTKSEFVYLWHDFWAAIKKNLVGAMALGIADLAVILLLANSILYYFDNMIMFFITFASAIIYFLMRFYLYILLITFRLSPLKLIKNAFILAVLGVKRNVAALFGILAYVMINALVLMFFPPMGIILPLFFLIAHCSFMACFAAYPNVKKYMIDPYYAEHPEKGEKFKIEEEPVFIDRG